MRLFHFLNRCYGLDDIEKRRLKISRLDDLNDPFELFSIDLSNKVLRKAFQATKEQLSERQGLLCFSKKWSNPVQWSHYADRHRGLCLGFDVADEVATPVQYSAKRLAREAESLAATGSTDEKTMLRFLSTKYAHWRYESEVRCFLDLKDKDAATGLYFADFSDRLKLVEVIVGACSDVSRTDIAAALGSLAREVQVFKARLAFKSFTVVRNRNDTLWV